MIEKADVNQGSKELVLKLFSCKEVSCAAVEKQYSKLEKIDIDQNKQRDLNCNLHSSWGTSDARVFIYHSSLFSRVTCYRPPETKCDVQAFLL